MNNYILSLGSNLGNREANIINALNFLSLIGKIIKKTSIYETKPYGMENTENFYNMVIEFETELNPFELLKRIKEYEKSQGRDIEKSHMKPRLIDIDILLNENNLIREKELIIPHKEIKNRYFIVFLLNELSEFIYIPDYNKYSKDLIKDFDDFERNQIVRKIKIN